MDNVVFANPSIGAELTVNFSKSSSDVSTATTKYMDLPSGSREVSIRSSKVFKVTKINGSALTDPSTAGGDATAGYLWEKSMGGTGNHFYSITFEPEEASGNFEVLVTAGSDGGNA